MSYTLQDIENYWLGKMSQNDIETFEKKLAEDDNLREEVKAYEDIFTGFEGLKIQHKIKNWSAEEINLKKNVEAVPSGKVRSLSIRRLMSIAAALLFLVIGYQFTVRPYSDNSIYKDLYSDKNTYTNIKSASTNNHPLQEGYDAYQNKEYDKAYTFFQDVSNENNHYATAQYYLAHTLMQQDNFQEAIAPLNYLIANKDARYEEEAEWLHILCQFRIGKTETVHKALDNILANPSNFHYQKAKVLQQKLNAFQRKLQF